jgi:hypothetical protein
LLQTTNLLLEAGSEALHTDTRGIPSIPALRAIKELHRETADRLGVSTAVRGEVSPRAGTSA